MGKVTKGSITSGINNKTYFYLNWEKTGSSIEKNETYINWEVGIGCNSGTAYWYSNSIKVKSVNINGSKVSDGGTWSNKTITSGSPVKLLSGTATIPHNADGTKTFNANLSAWLYSNFDTTASGDFELPDIPREATITSAPNFNDEQNPTITYSNPAGTSVTKLEACITWENAGTNYIAYRDINKTGSSYTFNLTDAERNKLRNINKNSNTAKVKFVVCTTIGSNVFWNEVEKTLTIVNANPTIGTLTYKDTNAVTKEITGNDQRIIRNNSTLLFSIGNATAKKNATISKYEVTFNGRTLSRTSAGNLDFGIVNISNSSKAVLKVIDTRGNTATKEIEVMVDDWELPKGIVSAKRKNNFYSETTLKVDGTYSSLNDKNTLAIQYIIRRVDLKESSYDGNLEDNVGKVIELDNKYQWHIQFFLSDRLGQTTYNLYLDRGIPLIFFDRLNENVGINCFPDGNYKLNIDGNTNGTNLPVATGYNSLDNFNRVNAGEYLYKSGMYSVNVNNAWYNILNVRHRNGNNDGNLYGFQLRSKFTMGSPLEYRQQNNGTWGEWKSIDTNDYSTTEQKIGTWVDGKPLYRKVIQYAGLAGGQVLNIATITGAETILIKNTYLRSTNDTKLVYPLNMVGYAGNLTDKVYVYSEKEVIKAYSSGGWSSSIWQLVVVVEYTKTTD